MTESNAGESGFLGIEGVNGRVEVRDGRTFWMGTEVMPCPLCKVCPTNVDDCGEFGNYDCPYFGIGSETTESDLSAQSNEGTK
jgi:hypothetical protein